MKIVVKAGGSMCIGRSGPMAAYIENLVSVLNEIQKNNQLIVAIGGGKLVRGYFKSISAFNLSRSETEWLAVDLLRANARFLAYLLKTRPIFSLGDINSKSCGVISGIMPGRSTDANAAYAAAKIKADLFIKLTNVDGIYTKDPNRFKSAKKLDNIKFRDLRQYSMSGKPGSYGILDEIAMQTIVKNKIRTIVMTGRKPGLLLDAIAGKKIGTLVS
jgi:uridylate kinase